MLDDGFWYYWPGHNGGYSAWQLRVLADELDRRNAGWVAQIDEYFANEQKAQHGIHEQADDRPGL